MSLASLACSRSYYLPSKFSIRFVSSKYIKPHPRSYRRRLYEAAVAPVLPETPKQCNLAEVLERLNRQETDYAEIELAEVKEIRRWIKEHEFRIMVVCQFLSVNGRTLWLARNQLRLNGLELREIDNKIAKKLFENTSFNTLEPLWCAQNVFLFGKDIDVIKSIIVQTKKTNFLIPLVVTYDNRIIPMKEIEKLAELPDLEALRAQTAAILDQIPVQLTQALGHHSEQLSAILGQISSTNAETTNN
jgi:ribosomal protein L10